jgi:hypothetical protein
MPEPEENFVLDERYTVKYIEREAFLFLREVLLKKCGAFRDHGGRDAHLDARIRYRWGLNRPA